jgi:hypothetical protein
MADKRQHTAKMNEAKLADAIDDPTTAGLIANQGGRSLLLVEAVHGSYVTAIDGTQTLSLLPGVVVLVPDEHAGPVRDLLRGLALGGPQALAFEDPGDAFVPPVEQSSAAVQSAATAAKQAAEDAADAAADPEAPLPTGAAQDDASGDETGDGDAGDPEGPWPGDDGYDAPNDEPSGPTAGDRAAGEAAAAGAADDVAAARAKRARGKAAGE